MNNWIEFMDDKQTNSILILDKQLFEQKTENYFLRAMQYFLYDPTWSMIQEFIQKNTTALFYESLLSYDDWIQYNPIYVNVSKHNSSLS